MPSGHSEAAALVCGLLYSTGILSFPVAATLTILFGLQRIYANRHTPKQVLVGWSLGILYAILYSQFMMKKSRWVPVGIAFTIVVTLTLILAVRVNAIVNSPVPSWLDPDLKSIVKTKQNANLFNKYIYTLAPLINSSMCPVYTWSKVESRMDTLLAAIEPPDAIVGIKSGGAILASYAKSKMPTTPTYYVKAKKAILNGSDANLFVEAYHRNVAKDMKYSFRMVEGITDSLEGKTVLLLDETVETGDTLAFVKEYLEKEKKVKRVAIGVLNMRKISDMSRMNPYVASPRENITVWPWGYDN
jgi:hypoxanthine phosphoribosyltransferase